MDGLKDLVIDGISMAVVIYGLLEAVKQTGKLRTEWAPSIALGLGVLFSVAYALIPTATSIVVRGLSIGLGASIAYAGVRKSMANAAEAAKNGKDSN